MLVMLERRLFTEASSHSPPDVQSESECTEAAGVILFFGAFPFLVDLDDACFGVAYWIRHSVNNVVKMLKLVEVSDIA